MQYIEYILLYRLEDLDARIEALLSSFVDMMLERHLRHG